MELAHVLEKYVVKSGTGRMWTPKEGSSSAFNFPAIDTKYSLKPFALTRCSWTTFESIKNDNN